MPIVTGPSGNITPVQVPNMVGDYAQLMQLRNAMQNAPIQNQILQQQAQSGQMQVQQEQQGMKDQQAFRAAMSDPSMQGKTIGDVADALARSGAISQQSWVAAKKADVEQRKSMSELDEKTLANQKAAHDATQQLYNNVMNMPDDQLQQAWPQIAQQYDAIPGNNKMPLNPQQPLTKQQLSQFGPALAMGNNYFDQELARREAQTKAKTEDATLAQKQAESQFYQQNGGAPGVSAELMQQSDWLKKNPDKGPSDYKLWVMQHSPTAVVMNNQLGGDQNQQALDFAAQNYRQTGQLPAGFSRSPQTTSAIISRAAQLDQQAGGQGVAVNKSLLESNRKSLDNLQKNFDQVSAFEGTAQKNLDLFIDKLGQIPDLGAKFANVPLRMINERMIGTADYQAMKAAQQTAAAEVAKVLSSSNASGVLSDSQKKEAEDVLSGNLSFAAAQKVAATLKQDFANRHQSYQQQIGDIQGRLKGSGAAPQAQQTSPMTITLPSGKKVTIE